MRARSRITAMAFAALFALSAVGTSSAQAASSLDVGFSSAIITATQIAGSPLKLSLKKETGSATLSTVQCKTGTLQGTTSGSNVTEVTLTPTYGECTLGGLEAAVKVNNCVYTLTNTAVARIANVDLDDFLCSIEIVQGSCVITIPFRKNMGTLSDIEFQNIGFTNPKHVEAKVTISMIGWEGGLACPAGIAGVSATNAELNGTTTVKAFVDVSGKEGAQIALEAT